MGWVNVDQRGLVRVITYPTMCVVEHTTIDPRPLPLSWQRGRTHVRLRGRARARRPRSAIHAPTAAAGVCKGPREPPAHRCRTTTSLREGRAPAPGGTGGEMSYLPCTQQQDLSSTRFGVDPEDASYHDPLLVQDDAMVVAQAMDRPGKPFEGCRVGPV